MSIIYEALKKMSQSAAKARNSSAEAAEPRPGPSAASAAVKPEGNALPAGRQGAASDKPEGSGAASDSRSHSRSHKPATKIKIALALVGTTVGIIITWLVMHKPAAQLTYHSESFFRSFPSGHPEARRAEGSYPVASLNNPQAPAAVNDLQAQNNEEKLPVPEVPELVLNGIVLSADGNLALINGEMLQAGDDIRGAKVQVITDKQVTLTFHDQEIILKKK